jgi:hypothetical protein
MLSECARKYFTAIAYPFSSAAKGACLPYQPDKDSLKANALVRFTVTADASGNAFILVSPTLASDAVSLWFNQTTGTVPITVVAAGTPPANYSAVAMSSIPFTINNLASGTVEGRVVSCGLRVTYTGSVSSMAGLYECYVDPSHQNLNATATGGASNIVGNVDLRVARVTSAPFEMGFGPLQASEQQYRGRTDNNIGYVTAVGISNCIGVWPWSNGTDINGLGPGYTGYLFQGGCPILFMVRGAAAGATFYVEYTQHVEYIGKSANFGMTPSHNDVTGANRVDAAVCRATTSFGTSASGTWSDTLRKTLTSVDPSHVMRAAGMVYRATQSLPRRQHGALMVQ